MRPTGGRSQLLDLRRHVQTVGRTIDLLEEKCDALIREITARKEQFRNKHAEVARLWSEAWRSSRKAQIELGSSTISSAALAQPRVPAIEKRSRSFLGARLVRLDARIAPFQPLYDVGDDSATLDRAGQQFTDLLPELIKLAEEQANLETLGWAMKKTRRLLNSLDKVVVRQIKRDIATLSALLEEEERDQLTRLRRRARPLGNSRSSSVIREWPSNGVSS